MSAETVVNEIISSARTTADTARDKAIEYADDAKTAATFAYSAGTVPNPTIPNVTIPPFDPTSDTLNLSHDFLNGYDDAVTDLGPKFLTAIDDFITAYFPRVKACLKTVADDWVCDTITGNTATYGETGLPIAVEAAMWNRGRDREVIDSRRVVDEAVSGFAARGWSLASGVLVDTVYRAQQAASDKASTISRDVMIKQADVKIENVKFAIGEANKLRLGVMSAFVSFINAWTDIRKLALEKAKGIVDSRVRLYSAIGEYYRAIIAAAGLMLDYDKIRIDKAVTMEKIFADVAIQGVENATKAAISAADAMGAIAAAALGAQNTLAEVAHQTSVSAES